MSAENYIIDRIEQLCEQKQMSRYRLAQKSGISQSSISTLLNRQSVPTIQTLEKLCKGLDMTLAQFFSEDDELPNLTEEQKRLLTTWNAMNEQEKALVEAIYARNHKKVRMADVAAVLISFGGHHETENLFPYNAYDLSALWLRTIQCICGVCNPARKTRI